MRIRLKALCSILVAIMVISSLSCAVFAANPPSKSGVVEDEYEWEYYDSDKRLVIKPIEEIDISIILYYIIDEVVLDDVETVEVDLSESNSVIALLIDGWDCGAEYLCITGAEGYDIQYLEIDSFPYIYDEDNILFPEGFTCGHLHFFDMPFTEIPDLGYLEYYKMTLNKLYCMEGAVIPDYVTELCGCLALQEVTINDGRDSYQ